MSIRTPQRPKTGRWVTQPGRKGQLVRRQDHCTGRGRRPYSLKEGLSPQRSYVPGPEQDFIESDFRDWPLQPFPYSQECMDVADEEDAYSNPRFAQVCSNPHAFRDLGELGSRARLLTRLTHEELDEIERLARECSPDFLAEIGYFS